MPSKVFVDDKITGISAHAPSMRRRVTHTVCARQSVLQIMCAERIRPRKASRQWENKSSRPVRKCHLDVNESLPKSAVFFARFFPRREVNIMRTRTWHKRPANAQTFKLAFSSRRRWHPCQSFGQLSPTHATNQEAECPTPCSSRSACND